MAIKKSSPYYRTKVKDGYLDIIDMPVIKSSQNDRYYTIENKYDRRPDLLA